MSLQDIDDQSKAARLGVTSVATRSDAASVDDAAPRVNNADAHAAPVKNEYADVPPVKNVDADAAPVNNVYVDAAPVKSADADAAPVDHVDADTAPVDHVYAPPEKTRVLSKPRTKRIDKRCIQCKKCEKFTCYSSSGSVKVNTKSWDRVCGHQGCLQNMHTSYERWELTT